MDPDTSRPHDPGAAVDTFVHAASLTRTYRRGSEDVHALYELNLSIPRSTIAVVLGPSGSGKSTLLNLIGGIDRPTAGRLRVGELELLELSEGELDAYRRRHVGFVFQFNNLLPNLDAVENVALPLVAQGTSWNQARAEARARLQDLGLGPRERHRPSELSGGEQQRVALARAVIGRPELVLADEPTGDLDTQSAESVLDLMTAINRDLGTTFIIATHNLRLAAMATQVVELRNGRPTRWEPMA